MTTLKEYLKSRPNMTGNIIEGILTIGDKVFTDACYYRQKVTPPENCQNPEPYTRESIMVLGEFYKTDYARNGKICFTMKEESILSYADEWYLAAYMTQERIDENPDFAPSDGPNMIPIQEMEKVLSELMAFDKVAKAHPRLVS